MPGQENIQTILRPHQLVGTQYRVEKLIAVGGMASVWAGVNERTGKRIALKVILQSFTSNRGAVELFRREALTASKINHPNVVNILDLIEHEGMTCIVMELFDGETLGSYLKRNGPLSLENTLTLLLPAMRGVAAANAQGVVHRDLKPANIFLCTSSDGQLITTKVLDFGISVIMRRSGETAPVTEPFPMFGTPAYMAPETFEFSPDIDGRADVYGFGVLLFEALTGKLPFPGPPGLELFKRITTDPPPKVSVYRSDLPIDVVNLIDCALAKNRDDRFVDMDHLIRATEDRLLPLLSSQRVLTPREGISLHPVFHPVLHPVLHQIIHPVADSTIGASVPVVQAAFEKEPSSPGRLGETRTLYPIANESLYPRKPASRFSNPRPRRILNRRPVIASAMIAFLTVTAWVTISASSSNRGKSHWQLSPSSEIPPMLRRPRVTAQPGAPTPPPVPIVAPVVAPEIAEAPAVVPVELPAITPGTLLRPAVPHSAKHRSTPKLTKRQPYAVTRPGQPAVPRAGRLSPADF